MNNQEFFNSITEIEKKLVSFYIGPNSVLLNAHRILEIGSGWGIFARSAMMANSFSKLTTIDKIGSLPTFDKNVQGFTERIERVVADSKEVLKKVPDVSYDCVFVDGDHGYGGALSDIKEAFRIVNAGGFVIIDDVMHPKNWMNDYGVSQAMLEFCFQNNLDVRIYPYGHGVAIIRKKT